MTGPAQIRRQDVIEDIRALVEVMGVSITEAIGTAVTAQLATERGKAATKNLEPPEASRSRPCRLEKLPVVGAEISDDDLYGPDGLRGETGGGRFRDSGGSLR